MKQFLNIVELRTKIVSVSTYLLASLWVFLKKASLDPVLAVLVFVAALAVDMGTTAFNTFFDYLNGTDNKKFNREADKVLVHEKAAPGLAFLVAAGLYIVAGGLGLIIGLMTSPYVIVVGALSLAVGFFYTGGPLPISRTPLGEVFAGGFLGGVFFLLVIFIQSGSLSPTDLWLAVPSTLMIASILTVNNTCDLVGDQAAGRRTLSILLGPKLAPWLIPFLGLAAWASLSLAVVWTWLPVWSLIPIGLGAGLTLPHYLKMFGRGFSHQTKGPSMGGISKIFLLFTMATACAFGLKFFFPGGN